ncbi:MAG TPA: cardiolipin synthase [Methylophilaceae bacterium]|nr:cardiolipin synthase [Methylophilaceae bacterium]
MDSKKIIALLWHRAILAALLAPILLASCGTLPTINPDMAVPRHVVQLEGAKGPLSAKRSKEILEKLKRGADETNIFDRHLALEESIDGSPLMVGNRVELLVDGPPTYDSMFAAIKEAKDNINMETFILEDDEIGHRFAAALLEKQQSGVQVNLMYDSVGSINTPKEFFQPLIDSGMNVLEFNPINPLKARKGWNVNNRDHRKLLVVDGKVAYVGGINISSVYSAGSFGSSTGSAGERKKAKHKDSDGISWRDTHLRMEGPVVGEFQKLFMETWDKQHGQPLAARDYYPQAISSGRDIVRAIGSSPDDEYSLMYMTLISAINSAETQVYITNAYFVPDPQLLTALKDAVARGVDVRLLLPSKTDSSLVFYASRSYYNELLSAGVKIYERQDAILHAKTALIDGVWSTVGSTNLDWRSFLHNQEINAVMLGQDFGAQMQTMFENDLQSSKAITLDEWKKRPLSMRIKESASRLWARWL